MFWTCVFTVGRPMPKPATHAGERLIRGKERQDARLRWRQRSSLAGFVLVRTLRLAGDGAVTVRRRRSICDRPLWLISRCQAPSLEWDPVTGDFTLGFARYDLRRSSSPPNPSVDWSGSLNQPSLATDGPPEGGLGRDRAPALCACTTRRQYRSFPTGFRVVCTDPAPIGPRYLRDCPCIGHREVASPDAADRRCRALGNGIWFWRKWSYRLVRDVGALAAYGECGDGRTHVRRQDS